MGPPGAGDYATSGCRGIERIKVKNGSLRMFNLVACLLMLEWPHPTVPCFHPQRIHGVIHWVTHAAESKFTIQLDIIPIMTDHYGDVQLLKCRFRSIRSYQAELVECFISQLTVWALYKIEM